MDTKEEDYSLTDEEIGVIYEAFESALESTIKDFLDEKYGDSLYYEEDVRLRLYHYFVSYQTPTIPQAKKLALISSENKSKLESKGKSKLDLVVKKSIFSDDDLILAIEIKLPEQIKNPFQTGSHIKNILKDLSKLMSENPKTKLYYLYFHTCPYRNSREEKKIAEGTFNKLKELPKTIKEYFNITAPNIKITNKKITFIYITRYQGKKLYKKFPYETGTVKSNDKNFEKLSKLN